MTALPSAPRKSDPKGRSITFASRPGATPGVSSRVISAAARHVAARAAEEWVDGEGGEIVANALAAIALAVDQNQPTYVREVLPRTTTAVTLRLVDMLRAEVLRAFGESAPLASPSRLLHTLRALEQVREAIDPEPKRQLGTFLTQRPQGLELLVEIAHDLRSPLTSILFLSETLQSGQSGDVNEIQHRQLGLIYSAALGLTSLVSDAVELVRGGDRLVEDLPTPFSVAQVLEAVRDMVRPISEEKGLSVRIRPPAIDHRLGHPMALSRVLLNLTCNALKFTEHGFVEVVAQARDGSRVEFSVRDTGSGIDSKAMTHLYKPFRPAGGRPGLAFSGTGLGLTICRRLIAAMGSKLEVETRSSWGTRFSFELDLPPATLQ